MFGFIIFIFQSHILFILPLNSLPCRIADHTIVRTHCTAVMENILCGVQETLCDLKQTARAECLLSSSLNTYDLTYEMLWWMSLIHLIINSNYECLHNIHIYIICNDFNCFRNKKMPYITIMAGNVQGRKPTYLKGLQNKILKLESITKWYKFSPLFSLKPTLINFTYHILLFSKFIA